MKLGRNDKCWCNSGLKYKKCHLGRDRETPVSNEVA
nr:SEC-C metal-binding domain-containing protein [Escherichia coli]